MDNNKDETLLIEMLIRKILSKNVGLNLTTREIWLLSCAMSFIENRNIYANKEIISLSYEREMISGKNFNFVINFSSSKMNINSSSYYSDMEGVYNRSSYVHSVDDLNEVYYDKRNSDKRIDDIDSLNNVIKDVEHLLLKNIKPKIYSSLLDLKMKSLHKIQIQLKKLEDSIDSYKKYGSEVEILKLEKKIKILKTKIKN